MEMKGPSHNRQHMSMNETEIFMERESGALWNGRVGNLFERGKREHKIGIFAIEERRAIHSFICRRQTITVEIGKHTNTHMNARINKWI